MAQVTSLSDQNCRHTFVDRMSSILAEQGEMQEVADKLAESTTTVLLTSSLGPRHFFVASPPGAGYGFFVEQKSSNCLLRLFSRQGLYAVQEQSGLHRHRFTHRVYVCRVGERVGVFVRRHKMAGTVFLGEGMER